jgi:hypothetical protein
MHRVVCPLPQFVFIGWCLSKQWMVWYLVKHRDNFTFTPPGLWMYEHPTFVIICCTDNKIQWNRFILQIGCVFLRWNLSWNMFLLIFFHSFVKIHLTSQFQQLYEYSVAIQTNGLYIKLGVLKKYMLPFQTCGMKLWNKKCDLYTHTRAE